MVAVAVPSVVATSIAIGTAVVAAGAATAQGIAANQQAQAEAEFQDFNARAASLEARRKGLVELERVNREQARQFAAIGGSGITPGGSATLPALETGRRASSNLELIRLGGQIESRAAAIQAENLRRKGRAAIFGGLIGGGSRGARLTQLGNP